MVVSTSAIDCLERLVPEMTYYVSSGTLNSTHSLLQHSAEKCGGDEVIDRLTINRRTRCHIYV